MNKPSLAGFLFVVLLCIACKSIQAQDPAFSQPYANPLYLNPAFAGTGNSQRIGLNYQYLSQEKFVTYNISFDRNFIDSNNGIGFLVTMEKSALNYPLDSINQALTTTNISLIYTHQFHIKSFTLSAGAQITYIDLNVNPSKLVYNETPYSPGLWNPPDVVLLRTSIGVPDISTGFLGYDKYYFLGLSFYHLTKPNESFTELPDRLAPKYSALVGGMIPIGPVTISPTILYQAQGYIYQTVTECYFTAWHITVGIGHRLQDALIFTAGYQGNLFRVGYSYDSGLPQPPPGEIAIPPQTAGSSEVSLVILLRYKSAKLKKVIGINCPTF